MFKKILIANRGEIAVRVIRTCREMGIETVAVYSDADENALHALEADEALYIGEAEPSKSYLNMEALLRTAHKTGAEAIHPGYGFLAENSVFATRCEAAGITFIGPPAQVIQALGDKTFARSRMRKAGIPVIPGMLDSTKELSTLKVEAEKLGFPLLIKAAAGGGGRGMRVVSTKEELEEACLSAMSEAEKAFGDGAVYLEKCLESPRHVEFQILGDTHGNVVHLFERECSIQRRHQKIVEESPSPALTPELRKAMSQAALAAARVAGYVNAGTVEFLLEPSGQFYFLEVNTRLQVEHPVTELTTGLDLVRHQIAIAAGRPLPFGQNDIVRWGHAIECRIYAEDPEAGFSPAPGPVLFYREPAGPGIRVDSGIESPFTVPIEYDPILSKLITVAEDREAARSKMIRALENYAILGIKTMIPFLLDVIRSNPFREGKTPTDFIDLYFPEWHPAARDLHPLAAAAHFLGGRMLGKTPLVGPAKVRSLSPWETLGQWRL